jgi:2-amino-4-hydroxy-6-hydroxymethyldihydropteridine diphosphokinase
MIIIAVGANLPGPAGPPLAQCEAALVVLTESGVAVTARSPWYDTPPDPPSDQPHYVNGVIAVATRLAPTSLLDLMLGVETGLGRYRSVPNAARSLDLDLIDYDGQVRPGPEAPILPHPRLVGRAFVLLPLRDIAPDWRHPMTGQSVSALIGALPAGHGATRLGGVGKAEKRPGNP